MTQGQIPVTLLPYSVIVSLLPDSSETARGGIILQIYSIFSTIEQNLRRICASGVNFCSIEVKMCRK